MAGGAGRGRDGPNRREVASRLHSLAIHLLRWVRSEDDATGLGPARLSALSVLVFGGERNLGELASAEQVTAPTMSRIVAALVEAGLVSRSPDPQDGRAVVLRATAEGRAVLEAGRARRVDRVAALIGELDEGAVVQLAELVDRLEAELARAREV